MRLPQYLYGLNEDLQRYFALLVQTLNDGLSDNGWTVSNQSTANITTIIGRFFTPVMPVGTIWFNTDLSKLQVLTTAAVPGISDGIVETITSV